MTVELVALFSHDQRSYKTPLERGGSLKDPDAHQRQAKPILQKPIAAMSGPLATVAADDFVLPVPTSHSEDSQEGRRPIDSSWSQRLPRTHDKRPPPHQKPLGGVWRHTIGIILLLATVFLWTASNFLASVGFVEGKQVAVYTDKLTFRLFLQTIATPNHTLLLILIHPSSLFCCYWLLQGGYGPAAALYKVLFVDVIRPPTICLLLKRRSKPLSSLTMREAFKKQADHRVAGY